MLSLWLFQVHARFEQNDTALGLSMRHRAKAESEHRVMLEGLQFKRKRYIGGDLDLLLLSTNKYYV